MITVRIHTHPFGNFHRRLRAIPPAVRASTSFQTIRSMILHILTLPLPLHGRHPLAQIHGLPTNTPPNHRHLTAASTPNSNSNPSLISSNQSFSDAAETLPRPLSRQHPLSVGHSNCVHRVAKTHNSFLGTRRERVAHQWPERSVGRLVKPNVGNPSLDSVQPSVALT